MKRLFELLTIFMLLATRMAIAQDSLRNAMIGDTAAEQSQQPSTNYTFKTGDFRLLLAPSMEVDWSDNVDLTKTDPESDFYLQPGLQLTATYPLTQRNLLSLSVGLGYLDYFRYSTNNRLTINSGSQLSFDTFIKDFRINFHDRFSLIDTSSEEPAVSGTSQYGSFVNVSGVTTTWDLRDLVLTLGFDYQKSVPLNDQFSYLASSSELPVARVGLHLRPDLTAGVEASASYTTYQETVLNNYDSYSAGIYADWKPSSTLRVKPRVGYTIFEFQHTSQSAQTFYYFGNSPTAPAGPSIQTQDLNSWYADLTVSHQITKIINYGLSAGHEVRPGIEADAVEDYYARPSINWSVVNNLGLTTSFFFEHGKQGAGNLTGNLVETYDYYGLALTATYPVAKKLVLSLIYRYTLRSSDIPNNEYTQDVVGLRLTYTL